MNTTGRLAAATLIGMGVSIDESMNTVYLSLFSLVNHKLVVCSHSSPLDTFFSSSRSSSRQDVARFCAAPLLGAPG